MEGPFLSVRAEGQKPAQRRLNADAKQKEAQYNNDLDKHNQEVRDNNAQVDGYNDLKHKVDDAGDTVKAGLEDKIKTDPKNAGNDYERADLDNNGWNINDPNYRVSDDAHHAAAENLQHEVDAAISKSSSKTGYDGASDLLDISRKTDGFKGDAAKALDQANAGYVPGHPQHPSDQFVEGARQAANNPGAQTDVYERIIDIGQTSKGLGTLKKVSEVDHIDTGVAGLDSTGHVNHMDGISIQQGSVWPQAAAFGAISSKAADEGRRNTETKEDKKIRAELKDLRDAKDKLRKSIINESLTTEDDVQELLDRVGFVDGEVQDETIIR